ncbi:MAG: hypothetical protein E6K96_09880 [Thaumarchaeota archaeon]|nr:MAG: hypothetical protein E6K96_09880 [Nitrososphaerota archaeon]
MFFEPRASENRRGVGRAVLAILVVILSGLAAVGIFYLQTRGTSGQQGTSTSPSSVTSSSSTSSQGPLPAVTVLSGSLKAADFRASGTTITFTCGTSAVGSFIRLSNTGNGTGSIITVTVTWNGATDVFTPLGQCLVGPVGSPTAMEIILFSATSKTTFNASVGGAVSGFVILSSGAEIAYAGNFE